jgi:chorismate synthase
MGTLRMTTAGESHGPAEVCVLSGIPAGLEITTTAIDQELARRQVGYGRGGRMAIEKDRCRFLAGVRHGHTLGSPIAIVVENRDHPNWLPTMSPDPLPYWEEPSAALTIPRPGHADFAGMAKHDHDDMRNVLERASARETVGRVAGGAVCKRLLAELGVTVRGRVTAVGPVALAEVGGVTGLADPESIDWEAVEASPVACEDRVVSQRMCDAIDRARDAGESLGGVFEVWCWGLCPGLGGYVTFEDRLDGRLLGAVGSIPAIKGVEVDHGFVAAARPGSQVHDPFVLVTQGERRWIGRAGNNAGGLEGGMTNGMPMVIRAAMKPIPTLTTPLASVDVATLEQVDAHVERSDVTAVPAARVVAEAMVAYVMAGAYLEKFATDSMGDLLGSVSAYRRRLEERGLWRLS